MAETPRYYARPLFSRLVDEDPRVVAEPRPGSALTRAQLLAQLAEDLDRLLNTRCRIPSRLLRRWPRGVSDYGVEDFTHLYVGREDDRREVERMIRQAITTFETRLRSVRVHVEAPLPDGQGLQVRIDGVLLLDRRRQPVSFPLTVRSRASAGGGS
ncbi:MAG: type VI secretion system baseplate subunit TssE [Alphaproteobacteria bacterium]|nr:type VI secretion system baseplate subunit TssE [Alphaproteobacteria bacterium]